MQWDSEGAVCSESKCTGCSEGTVRMGAVAQ